MWINELRYGLIKCWGEDGVGLLISQAKVTAIKATFDVLLRSKLTVPAIAKSQTTVNLIVNKEGHLTAASLEWERWAREPASFLPLERLKFN